MSYDGVPNNINSVRGFKKMDFGSQSLQVNQEVGDLIDFKPKP